MMTVSSSLRTWFVVHFVLDYLFALPLFIAPEWFLGMLGWTVVDPFATRLVAAALFGIGGVSLVARGASRETYRHLLSMKLVWSGTAIVGMLATLNASGPWFGWIVVGLFTAFFFIWCYYRVRLQ